MEYKHLKIRLRMEQLITQREGMIAENKMREICGNSLAYSNEDFDKLQTEFCYLETLLEG